MATYAELFNVRDTVGELTQTKLPPRLSLQLARSARKLFEALEILDGVRNDLVKTYAKHTDKGEIVVGDDGYEWEDKEAFEKEMNEALEADAEVEFTPILLKHLPKNVQLTPAEAFALEQAGIIQE